MQPSCRSHEHGVAGKPPAGGENIPGKTPASRLCRAILEKRTTIQRLIHDTVTVSICPLSFLFFSLRSFLPVLVRRTAACPAGYNGNVDRGDQGSGTDARNFRCTEKGRRLERNLRHTGAGGERFPAGKNFRRSSRCLLCAGGRNSRRSHLYPSPFRGWPRAGRGVCTVRHDLPRRSCKRRGKRRYGGGGADVGRGSARLHRRAAAEVGHTGHGRCRCERG